MTDSTAGAPQSSGEVGWWILATGSIARMFASDLARHGHRIAAVGSRTPESARRFADEFDVPAAHGSHADLVADPQVDIVYVATPHHLHKTNACDALAAGNPLSFAHDLLGPPTKVLAHGVLGPTGVDVSVATILDHGSGAVSTSYSSLRTRGPNRAVVLGTEGRIEIDAVWYTPTAVTVLDAKGQPVERFAPSVSGRGMQYQAAEAERLLAAGERVSPLMTPEDSVAVMTAMDQVRAAIGLRYPSE